MTTASDALVTSVVHIFLLHSESAASSLREHYGICAFVADPAWSEVVEAASRLVEFCRKAKADLQQCRFAAVCLLAIALAEESLRYAVREAKHPAHKDRRVFRALGNFSRHCAQYAADAAGSRRNGHVDEANDWEAVAWAGMVIARGPLPQCEGIEQDMKHTSNAARKTAVCQDTECKRIWERAIKADGVPRSNAMRMVPDTFISLSFASILRLSVGTSRSCACTIMTKWFANALCTIS
jgi:hypothetical protein